MNKVPEKKGITINEAKKLINAANPTDLLNLGLEIQLQLAMAEKSKNLIPEKDLKFLRTVIPPPAGSMRSSITSSGFSFRKSAVALYASKATRVLNPAVMNLFSITLAVSISSSTISIFPMLLLFNLI
jgi:hypothetical protein